MSVVHFLVSVPVPSVHFRVSDNVPVIFGVPVNVIVASMSLSVSMSVFIVPCPLSLVSCPVFRVPVGILPLIYQRAYLAIVNYQ